jgi:hypothetical protein
MLKHGCDRNTATFFKQRSMKKRPSLYCVMRAAVLMPEKMAVESVSEIA